MTKVQNAEGEKLDPKTDDAALDADKDGLIDLDPEQAHMTMIDLVVLDHQLRDAGSSLATLLRAYARSSAGLRL